MFVNTFFYFHKFFLKVPFCGRGEEVDISRYLSAEEKENQLNLSLYIISLIEHKTKVEYNVGMQILRYMIFILEDYEKNKKLSDGTGRGHREIGRKGKREAA